jgi:hypothetical protein
VPIVQPKKRKKRQKKKQKDKTNRYVWNTTTGVLRGIAIVPCA